MNPHDFVPGKLPVVLMAMTVMFAVTVVLLVWSVSQRREYVQVEKEIIIITSVVSAPTGPIPYQP